MNLTESNAKLEGLRHLVASKHSDISLRERELENLTLALDKKCEELLPLQRMISVGRKEQRKGRDAVLRAAFELLSYADRKREEIAELHAQADKISDQAMALPISDVDVIAASILGRAPEKLQLAQRALRVDGTTVRLWDGSALDMR